MPIVEISVSVDCQECESKVRKALLKLKGVHDVEVDRKIQKVTVTGSIDEKKILNAVRATGKRATILPSIPSNNPVYYYEYQTPRAQRRVMKPQPSSYNYRVHGYDESHSHGYYNGYATSVGDGARSYFSDENPTACSIM
ncbi:hypothetical protein LUZ60_012498 [Juncus effusus]|nr:hypothetical protein LUZ60_012498 [Juncus effusus]